ncbi:MULTISPECIES: paeninodin family lasso peptide [Priestia]|uniref:paeninodin family lasso peptide n=1 Tax=Priestia TaxID=2800373 RepID=UPI00232C9CC3|nr:paeninodin family lasso peptide [Priestia sp. AB]MDC0706644.1 paeninodin family lasso peptide [Priestia sp. AB]
MNNFLKDNKNQTKKVWKKPELEILDVGKTEFWEFIWVGDEENGFWKNQWIGES